LLGDLQMPIAAIPGNHDRRAPMRKALPDPAYGAADSALNALRSVGELDILLIDSTVPGAPNGELDTATLAWLDGALAASAPRPALLFLHHPPLQHRLVYMAAMRLRNADALAALLERHPRALLVAAGHVRRAAQTCLRRRLCHHLPGRRTSGHS
jgi:3',5'-cyclic AMP phosphodiesterase CpdA